MKKFTVFLCSGVVFVFLAAAFDVRAEENKQLSLDSMMGKYEGSLQVHGPRQNTHAYRSEIVAVDTSANTVSLVASCPDCETTAWKRNNCAITEAKENIKFICKAKFGNEEYVFNGENLRASGVGAKYPYTISVTKVVK